MTVMTCEKFEAILPEYLEGDVSDEVKAKATAHATACESCAKIVADIERITAEAAALPGMRPARDLWSGIEQRISAPVIPLGQPAHRVRRFAFTPMAAAAAALIVTTAGITYLATSRLGAHPQERVAFVPTKAPPQTVDSTVTTPDVAPVVTKSPIERIPSVRTPSATLASNDPSARRVASPTLSPQADAAYAEEIGILEKMIASPKSGLDPATVQVVKKNLQVIDDAIAQSKAALAKDPASTLLYDQMTRAMNKKVELLRTVASLSSST
jgi:hypothetical protein